MQCTYVYARARVNKILRVINIEGKAKMRSLTDTEAIKELFQCQSEIGVAFVHAQINLA